MPGKFTHLMARLGSHTAANDVVPLTPEQPKPLNRTQRECILVRAVLPSLTGLPRAVCRCKCRGLHVSQATSASASRAPRYSPSGADTHPVRRAKEPTSARATTTPRRSRVVIAVVRKAPPTVRRDPTARWSRPTPEATPRGPGGSKWAWRLVRLGGPPSPEIKYARSDRGLTPARSKDRAELYII